ncbi:NAD(P)/FAD-dependent oxidoreductase [Streptomyces sp. GESEQ-4]|uniref:FAD-dependent oxidoreductase n=1 Tax=Streptomyces sp. GESEQ-4 TaxID=2812655 RepID=UPI001B32BE0F|nr:hypothetical protein [Streptomyces sp. GESEQ-4]
MRELAVDIRLTTGLALRHAGTEVVICERAPKIRADGASLGLWANALAVLDDLAVGEQVRCISVPTEMYSHDAAVRLLDTPEFGPEDHQYLLVHRAEFNDLLADAVGRGDIRLATGFTAYDAVR